MTTVIADIIWLKRKSVIEGLLRVAFTGRIIGTSILAIREVKIRLQSRKEREVTIVIFGDETKFMCNTIVNVATSIVVGHIVSSI